MQFVKRHNTHIILMLLLVLITGPLRLINLGFSHYIPDEVAVMYMFKEDVSSVSLIDQNKGPFQWLLVWPMALLGLDIYNEFIFRLPYALFNIMSVLAIYLFVTSYSKSQLAGFLSALIFGVNGFSVGFGRIVQYQSLNLFFSFLALYFASAKRFNLAFISLALSFYAHWDAVYFLPVFIYMVRRADFSELKKGLTIFLAIFASFFGPYLLNLLLGTSTTGEYLISRTGLNFENNFYDFLFKIELYNPFYFLWFALTGILISMLFLKRTYLYYIWFLIVYLVFDLFILNPGTHVYNILLPVYILCGVGFGLLINRLPKMLKVIPLLIYLAFAAFLWYQSFIIFTDTKSLYPWEVTNIHKMQTKEYDHKDITNHLLGFPYYKGWEEVSNFISSSSDYKDLKYITNDNRSFPSFYLKDMEYGQSENGYLAIGIKRPYSFVNDYKFSQIRKKNTIKIIEDENGSTLARIYYVEPRK